MKRKYRKLRQTKCTIKRRKSSILKRPQLRKNPIPRKKRATRVHYATPPVDVDAAGDILFGSTATGPAGTLIGTGSATVQAFTHIGISGLEKIREKAEETRKAERESGKTQGGSHGR